VGSVRGNAVKTRDANARAADLVPVIDDLRAEGRRSLRQLAAGLTERGIRTPMGRSWTPTGVKNLLRRISSRRTGDRRTGNLLHDIHTWLHFFARAGCVMHAESVDDEDGADETRLTVEFCDPLDAADFWLRREISCRGHRS
jgi:hypothetical protein